MNKRSYDKHMFFIMVILLLGSCDKKKNEIAFYHWKHIAEFNDDYKTALNAGQSNKIYMHYFDVTNVPDDNEHDTAYPIYVLRKVAKEYKDFDIVPVVYIQNKVLKNSNLNTEDLARKITDLINEISEEQFDKTFHTIQIDCDWTETTKEIYFWLLEMLKENFDVDVTIRLHQIKYAQNTGIPPVGSGTLMLYNVGDLKNVKDNSILDNKAVKAYIDSKTSYPIPLNVALPLFDHTIIWNLRNEVKIINSADRSTLENDDHFQKDGTHTFKVVKDTLYKGFFLTPGFKLKPEIVPTEDIISSYQTIKTSNISMKNTIFYHLDEACLLNHDLIKIIESL